MRTFGKIVVGLLLFVLGWLDLIGLQYLAWHGPQFLMWTNPANEIILSPLIAAPMMVFAIAIWALIPVIWCNA